jgi:hypothetical protein
MKTSSIKGEVSAMKIVLMITLILSFPIALWFLNQNYAPLAAIKRSPEVAVQRAESLDLKAAAEVTMRKISEIDLQISASRGEILRHEAERKKVTNELAIINEKINEVLRNPSPM